MILFILILHSLINRILKLFLGYINLILFCFLVWILCKSIREYLFVDFLYYFICVRYSYWILFIQIAFNFWGTLLIRTNLWIFIQNAWVFQRIGCKEIFVIVGCVLTWWAKNIFFFLGCIINNTLWNIFIIL